MKLPDSPLRALVVCPGRGSYTNAERGYLRRPLAKERRAQLDRAISAVNAQRAAADLPALEAIDGADRLRTMHHAGENISSLILACTALDFLSIDESRVELVAAVGNSMGWYSALFCAGALTLEDTFTLVQTMGAMGRDAAEGLIGGQLLYPTVDDNWRRDPAKVAAVESALQTAVAGGLRAGHSIRFGGFAVVWGEEEALAIAESALPALQVGSRTYPLRLRGHAAFHSSLLQPYSTRGLTLLGDLGWRQPTLPLIDGRGHQWQTLSTDPTALGDYTLRTQVLETYDFTASIRVAMREYAPDLLLCLGPGDSLGAAVAHVLIADGWQGITDRAAFSTRQAESPLLISFARAEQRTLVASN